MDKYAKKLLRLSIKAFNKNEMPVAAIIVKNDKIISESYNKRNVSNLTIDHAEIMAITKANKKLKTWRLNNCTLYVTLEPCDMCKNVIKESRLEKVYYIIKRQESKLQYNKVSFFKINENQIDQNTFEKYNKIINLFWKNKRNKDNNMV